MRRGIAAVCAALLLVAAGGALAQSFQPFVVKDIRVEGLQRTEAGTVFSYLPIKVGETMNEEKARQAVRALYATGFFQDVRLEVDNDVLVVFVQERPAIAQIDFAGMKEFEPDNIKKALRELGLAEGRIFDRALLDSAEQEMKRQYLSKGLYATAVQVTVTPLERNRVAINITVTEGEVARISGINIVGARAFSEDELIDQMVLRTPGWLTWYTKHDRYARERLAADLETLRSFYQNRGYLDFSIESTQVSITPDRLGIYVTVNITEGEKYTVTGVRLSGQMLVPREELERLVQLKTGDVFSREKLAASTKAITDRLGNDGYAFANANAIPDVDKEKRTVAFNIVIDPGRRVYVRRIDVGGNVKTRDEVVRREMRQIEGAYYDASRIQLSRRRIDRTGYFSEVNVETQPVEASPDQVDIVYNVKERPTGALLFGLGFSNVEKLALSASLTQANVFGTGNFLSFNVNSGSVNKVYSLSYLNPYWTVDGVSQGFDVYRRKTNASSLTIGAYATDTYGGGIKFGYPISEYSRVDAGFNMERVRLDTFDTSPIRYVEFVNQFGHQYTYGALTAGWARDTRDSLIQTNAGALSRITSEIASGDLQYYRLGAQQQFYAPLTRTYTLFLGMDVGFAEGWADKPLPFFKNYYAGGPGTVRGYQALTLGPIDDFGTPLGGNRKFTGNAEILFPVPGAQQDRSLRLSWFLDGGNVFNNRYELNNLRYATGLSFSWASPFGPLRLSFAQPLNAKSTDHVQRLQFTFGTAF
ncbi:MAG: outer membrane protein insertion porin family [Betaproteobacteria bacterium]|jgi:outer membrane protein insertion porin family|nr:outer membrane protein insertion porin family [Betaproteobacteria bacterium]